jgi:hypothetical protein
MGERTKSPSIEYVHSFIPLFRLVMEEDEESAAGVSSSDARRDMEMDGSCWPAALPAELFGAIFSFLDNWRDLARLCCTCWCFRRIADDPRLWFGSSSRCACNGMTEAVPRTPPSSPRTPGATLSARAP